MNKRKIGGSNESLACDFITSHGGLIAERNFSCRQGEVDIIALDGGYLCFIEVKYRKDESFGLPEEAVSFQKQKKICKVSKFYLYSKYKSFDIPIRYDVLAISVIDGILSFRWIKDAFCYIE